jgi:hypothetical protein
LSPAYRFTPAGNSKRRRRHHTEQFRGKIQVFKRTFGKFEYKRLAALGCSLKRDRGFSGAMVFAETMIEL